MDKAELWDGSGWNSVPILEMRKLSNREEKAQGSSALEGVAFFSEEHRDVTLPS